MTEEINLNNPSQVPSTQTDTQKQTDKIFFGLCAFLSYKYGIKLVIIRIAFLTSLMWGGAGMVFYFVLSYWLKEQIKELDCETDKNYFYGMIFFLTGILYLSADSFFFRLFNAFNLSYNSITAVYFFTVGFLFLVKADELFGENSLEAVKLKLSGMDVKFLGVCAGLANYTGTNVNAMRMIWMIFAFATAGLGLVLYIAIYFFLKGKEDE